MKLELDRPAGRFHSACITDPIMIVFLYAKHSRNCQKSLFILTGHKKLTMQKYLNGKSSTFWVIMYSLKNLYLFSWQYNCWIRKFRDTWVFRVEA